MQDENAMYNMYMKRAPTIEFKQPPTELCNGSDWDPVSQKMWEKFASRQQTEETYRHKVSLWSIVDRNIKVYLYRIRIPKNLFLTLCFPFPIKEKFDATIELRFVFGRFNGVWLRFGYFRCRYVSRFAAMHSIGTATGGSSSFVEIG